MAKATAGLPRRRGRPNVDNTDLVTDVLVEFMRSGAPSPEDLDRAIRAVADARATRESTEKKSMRERTRGALRDMEINWLRVFEVAEERGVAVPRWLPNPPKIHPKLQRVADHYAERQVEAEHMRRLMAFLRAFDDILPTDTPISTINQRFLAHRQMELRWGGKNRPKTA